jgi:hypothetical protein
MRILGIHGARYEAGGPFENLNELLYMRAYTQREREKLRDERKVKAAGKRFQ